MPARIQAARGTRQEFVSDDARHRRRRHRAVVGLGVNTGSGVTTGSGRSAGSGTGVTGPQRSGDAAINEENKEVDRKIKSICRGC